MLNKYVYKFVDVFMNYKNIYDNLILHAKSRGKIENVYGENHHIVPVKMGGNNDKNNLVWLTFKEHFVAHHLLCKIYKTKEMYYAFHCMRRDPHGYRKLTSILFNTIKKNHSGFMKEHAKIISGWHRPKAKTASKQRMLSDQNPMKKNPEKNPGKKSATVYFLDGRIKEYMFLKDLSNDIFNQSLRHSKHVFNDIEVLKTYNILKIEIEHKKVAVEGRKWYNNGVTNIYTHEIPSNDYVPGMVYKKRTQQG